MTVRVLTGVTPSGTLHLGNYVGAIRPAIQKSRAEGTESFYFLSDWIPNACIFIVKVIFLRRWNSTGF